MKKIFVSLSVLLSVCLFSTKTFAQEVPGGSSDGLNWTDTTGLPIDGGVTSFPAQPTGVQFTRNNGDGTCGDKAQVRVYYNQKPTIAPHLEQIWYQGSPLFSNFQPVDGDLRNFETKGYVSFCLTTSNIPPAIKLTIDVQPSPTQSQYHLTGTN